MESEWEECVSVSSPGCLEMCIGRLLVDHMMCGSTRRLLCGGLRLFVYMCFFLGKWRVYTSISGSVALRGCASSPRTCI